MLFSFRNPCLWACGAVGSALPWRKGRHKQVVVTIERRWQLNAREATQSPAKSHFWTLGWTLQFNEFLRVAASCKLVRVGEAFEQIDECNYLFLAEIEELDGNSLRLLVREGRAAGEPQDVHVTGHTIHDCTPIGVTDESAVFEIVWEHYVAYCVLNESFAFPPNDEEVYTGKRLRVYSKSRFRQYISRSTFATDEYPSPIQHYEVCCEDHIVNVISTSVPRVNQLRPNILS